MEPCFNEKKNVSRSSSMNFLLQKTNKKNEDYAMASFQFI